MDLFKNKLVRDLKQQLEILQKKSNQLVEQNKKLADDNHEVSLALGESPIMSLDLKARYHMIGGGYFKHNRSVVELPNGKFQIVIISEAGKILQSTDMGVANSQEEVLVHMNKNKYIKLKDI